MKSQKSECCEADVFIETSTVKSELTDCWYICSKCHQPCDLISENKERENGKQD